MQQERLRALGEMSSGIAHDFNNQLTVLVGYTELLLLNDAQILSNKLMAVRYLQTVRTAAHDSAGIVGRLREFYRQRDAQEIFLPLDLSRLVHETATLTQPKWRNQARAAGCKVSVRLDLGTLPDVAGNAAELREVVTNLIFNAVDAMPEGGEITLRTRRAGEAAVVFEVVDSGIGMTEEVRRRCLEPFFTTKSDRGGGLGLSVVYGVVKRHEGALDILTEPGGGTTIVIRLPVSQGRVPLSKSSVEPGSRLGRSLKVLVVEDDPLVREVVSEYLRRDEHEVSTAVSGREGLEKFGEGRFRPGGDRSGAGGDERPANGRGDQGAAGRCPDHPADGIRRYAACFWGEARGHRRGAAKAAPAGRPLACGHSGHGHVRSGG